MAESKTIQSVQRALDILNCFDDSNTILSLAQISEKLSLNKSTTHGLVSTLSANGYLFQASPGKYSLGTELARKGVLAEDVRLSILSQIAEAEFESYRFVLTGTLSLYGFSRNKLIKIISLECSPSHYAIKPSDKSDYYATASGKLLLSTYSNAQLNFFVNHTRFEKLTDKTICDSEKIKEELQNIKSSGYAFEDGEAAVGISAIACPVFDKNKEIMASVSLTSFDENISSAKSTIVSTLKACSDLITAEFIKFSEPSNH